MKENKDYQLIPVDVDNDQAWEIRILSGEFVENIIRFGNIQLDGKNDQIKFSFVLTDTVDPNLTVDNVDLQKTAGLILSDLIENGIENGSLLMDEK